MFKDVVIDREKEFVIGLLMYLCLVVILYIDVEYINYRMIGVVVLEKEVLFIEMGIFD